MEDKPTAFLKWFLGGVFVIALLLTIGFYTQPKPLSDSGVATSTAKTEQAKPVTRTVRATSSTSDNSDLLIRAAEILPPSIGLLVVYDNNGFHPSDFTVKPGTSVRFLNKSTNPLFAPSVYQHASPVHPPSHEIHSLTPPYYYPSTFPHPPTCAFR